MLLDRALAFANHLLAAEDWATARLKPFAGHTARLEVGAFALPLRIDGDGRLRRGDKLGETGVSIRLPDDTPLRWLTDRASVFAAARISGSADFAEALAFVFRNLRWDVEADLASVVGDIAAHRLLRGARELGAWQGRQLRKLAANVAEFLTEERPTLTRAADVSAFCGAVDALRDDCARLESRLLKLAGG